MFNAFNAISLGLTLVFSRYPSIKHIKFPFKHKIKKEDTIISKNVPVDDQCIEQIESNVSNTIKDINRRVHKCIEYFKKNEEITINACREITGEAGNSDVPKEILKDLISQKTAIVNLYRNILFIRPFLGHFNQNDGKNKKQFLFEIDHVVNFYIDLFKKYQKNKAHSILVETLVEHIFYVSCMQNFIGIQLLMLAETYHLRQKEKSPETFLFINDHTPSIVYNDRHNTDIYYKKIIVYINSHNLSCTDEELDELFISNYDIYKKWLSQKYNLIQNDSLVEAINTMVTNMRQYRDSYTIENYRYSFIYKMTNPYLIEMALKNHLENGFLDMDDIDKTIHIELFFEFMALYATNADAINERPIYKGFFLNDFLLTQTLLNNIIKTSAYVEKILVQDLQNEILYQNVVTSDTEEKIKSLGSDEEMEWLDKKPLEIIVNTIPPVNDHHQVHTMYKIVFQKSIKERIENLLLTNIAPKLNNLIVSLEDNSGLNAILAVEKQVFFSN
ncbi:MAG TPA: hypothetical protein VL201_00540, partial [Patescibacteria group bacterium]|nr:hypothetical protein [Patescibacteria group bacterium]